MGRAIVREPQVFLFDEPLSNLDAKLRVAMRAELKALHQRLKATTVYVTHDQVEAMTMAGRIVVMHDGVVERIGEPLELYDRPRNLFVAQFIGSPAMNVIHGKLRRAGADTAVETQDGIRWPVLREPAAGDGLDVVARASAQVIRLRSALRRAQCTCSIRNLVLGSPTCSKHDRRGVRAILQI